MFRTYFLICAFFIVSYNGAIIQDLQSPGGLLYRLGNRNAEFGEGIRDWLTNIKNRIFNRDYSSSNNYAESPHLRLEPLLKFLEVGDSVQRMNSLLRSGQFSLDLSNLKLNPNKDWGFRIGNWLIIRRHPSSEEAYSNRNVEDWNDWDEFFNTKTENNGKSSKDNLYPKVVLHMPKPPLNNGEGSTINGYEEISAEIIKPQK